MSASDTNMNAVRFDDVGYPIATADYIAFTVLVLGGLVLLGFAPVTGITDFIWLSPVLIATALLVPLKLITEIKARHRNFMHYTATLAEQ